MSVTPAAPAKLIEKGALSTGALNMGGHGNDGQVETGMGQTGPFDNNKIILTFNEWAWGPQIDRIGPSSITLVSIWSCHTGTGQDGADLLYAMAKHCGRAVRGMTGFLYCNSDNLWMENGSVWQVATPNNKPNPIPAPSPHFIMANVKFEVGGHEFEAPDVQEIEIAPQSFGVRHLPSRTVHGQAAQGVVTQLFRSLPMDMNVQIGAMITASIRVKFPQGDISFTVYNDRLAVDPKTHTGYYISSVQALYSSLIP
jgi:hypothetical protein